MNFEIKYPEQAIAFFQSRLKNNLKYGERPYFHVAIYALEKQVEKKLLGGIDCPNCHSDIINWGADKPFYYCPNCGQSLDWRQMQTMNKKYINKKTSI